MNPNPALKPLRLPAPSGKRILQAVLLGLLPLGPVLPSLVAADNATASSTGIISGTVTNKTTGNGLEGARVEIPSLGLSTLVDHSGQYTLSGVPAGSHEVMVSYTSLDTQRVQLTVTAGTRATRDFEMTSGVYVLDAFKVAGEKEGNAAALQQKRNADNLKEIVAMDAYGNMPNLNATELALRLPGVSFADPGDEVVEQIQVRGMGQGTTAITVDGALMSSFSAQNRTTRMTAFNSQMFESLEVIKGQTPDMSAESLGGTVNFRSRSPLANREKRRITYNFSMTTLPSFVEEVPLFHKRATHELLNMTYQEKFAINGQERLGVFVNLFYSENAFGFFRTQRDYQQTNSRPAYLWDYRTLDDYNNRMQRNVNTKFDYKLAPNSMLHVNLAVNDAPEPMRRQYQTRAFTGSQTTVPSATTGIVPGAFDDRVTVVRAVPTAATATSATTPAAAIDVTSTLINRNQRLRQGSLSGEHKFGPFDIDWIGTYSRTRYRTLGNEGQLVNRIGGIPFIGPNGLTGSATNNVVGPQGQTGVGWILDRSQDDLHPRFLQNGGLDFTNPNNYRPTVNGLTSNAGDLQEHLVRDVKLNVRYSVPITAFTLSLKAGGEMRDQSVLVTQFRRRWSYTGKDALPTDPSVVLYDQVKNGRQIPVWEGAQFIEGGTPIWHPELWQEDKYFHEQTMYTGFNYSDEKLGAAYLMTQGKIGAFGFAAGARREVTTIKSFAFNKIRAAAASTAAQQTADPVGSAAHDYADGFSERDGTYGKWFPSLHMYRNWTPDLKTRASWSTSIARPGLNKTLPTATVNDTAHTVTTGNPGLRPQWAQTYDLSVEYAFSQTGFASVTWFHKRIRDYLVDNLPTGIILGTGPDNGFQGQYGGYELFTTRNAGTGTAQGWEFSYTQTMRFLPGLLKQLTLNTNLSLLNIHGDLGTGAYVRQDQVLNAIPRTGNISLSWNYRKFGTRILYNYTSQSIRTAYSYATPSRNNYMFARDLVNLNLSYKLSQNMRLNLDIANVFNEPQRYYRGIPDQLERYLLQGTKFTLGIDGTF